MSLDIINNNITNCFGCSHRKNNPQEASPLLGLTIGKDPKLMIYSADARRSSYDYGFPFNMIDNRILDNYCMSHGIYDYYLSHMRKCLITAKTEDRESSVCFNKHFKDEVDAISPRVILLLGASAYNMFCGYTKNSPLYLKAKDVAPTAYFHGIPVLTTVPIFKLNSNKANIQRIQDTFKEVNRCLSR